MNKKALIAVIVFVISSVGLHVLHAENHNSIKSFVAADESKQLPANESWNMSAFNSISKEWDRIDRKYADKQKLENTERIRKEKELRLKTIQAGAGKIADKNGDNDD